MNLTLFVRLSLLITAFCCASRSPLVAAVPPQLLKDINTTAGSTLSNLANFCAVGDTLFFTATDVVHGRALWKSDGTGAGTVMVKDFSDSRTARNFVAMGGRLYFIMAQSTDGRELWSSDGTEAGTILVKDFNDGLINTTAGLCVAGDVIFFNGYEPATGGHLWKSDGSTAGTVRVNNHGPGTGVSSLHPMDFAASGSVVYFRGLGDSSGAELWRSDGTAAGTVMVKDIAPGEFGASPSQLVVAGGAVFFSATTEAAGTELWRSDGTAAGTQLMKDILPGMDSSHPNTLTALGSTLYFSAADNLWKSDGTPAGTVSVPDNTGSSCHPNQIITSGGILYFVNGTTASGSELWRTDGTQAGTVIVKDIIAGTSSSTPGSLTDVAGTLFFTATTTASGRELWRSDGTEGGTVMVKDAVSGSGSPSPSGLTAVGSRLFYAAVTGGSGSADLWVSDGTGSGTQFVKDIITGNAASNHGLMVEMGGFSYFTADDGVNGRELWRTNGTTVGTTLVKDIRTGSTGSGAHTFVTLGGQLYFIADNSSGSPRLWKSDGTSGGTTQVGTISSVSGLVAFNGDLYLYGFNGATLTGSELYKCDGTTGAITLVKDIYTGSSSSSASSFVVMNGALYFSAISDRSGRALWKTDGTTGGTVQVADPYPESTTLQGNVENLMAAGSTLFFTASDGVNGVELWKSDGTTAGTVMVKDIMPGGGTPFESLHSGYPNLVAVGGTVYFQANDGVHGTELWKSDGTGAGTVMVKDIHPSGTLFQAIDLTEVDGVLYFPVDDGTHGTELWRSDGTEAGTVMVKDIQPGAASSGASYLAAAGDLLFFVALDPIQGSSVWVSGGTAATTAPLPRPPEAAGGWLPSALQFLGGRVYFQGRTTAYHTEPYTYSMPTLDVLEVSDLARASVTLHGIVNPQGAATTAVFEYGTTAAYGLTAPVTLAPDDGSAPQVVTAPLTGLAAGTVHHYRLTAAGGTSGSTADATFTTPPALTSLTVGAGTLSPAFAPGTTSYTASVPYTTTSITLTPTVDGPNSTVRVNGTLVTSGSPAAAISLGIGANFITTVVTAQDGSTTATYALVVHRAAPARGALGFSSAIILAYEAQGTVQIPIIRTGGVDEQVGATLIATPGTAHLDSDYDAPASPTVTFGQGVSGPLHVAIPIRNPAGTDERMETFTVTLDSLTGGASLGPITTATVHILDSVDGAAPRVPSIAHPSSNGSVGVETLGAFTAHGNATDNKGVVSVKVQLNTDPPQDAVLGFPGAASTGWSISLTPVTGTNKVTVQTFDALGRHSDPKVHTFKVLRPLAVTVSDSTLGSVTPAYASSSYREVGKSCTIAATAKVPKAPFEGALFTGWTLGGFDVARSSAVLTNADTARIGMAQIGLTKNTVTFIFREGMTLRANFVPNPFKPLAGTYNGLISPSATLPVRDGAEPDGTRSSLATEGFFTATVHNTGAFSGRLSIDGLVLNVAGAFDEDGDARFGTARQETLVVTRTGKPSLHVGLRLNVDENNVDSEVDDVITGTVTAKRLQQSVTEAVSLIEADRAYYDGVNTVVPTAYVSAGTAKSTYTAVLPARDPYDVGDVAGTQIPGFAKVDYPQGHGYATVTLTKGGAVTLSGTAADGTTLNGSATLSRVGVGHSGRFALFVPLHGKLGFLSGFVALDSGADDSDMAAVHLHWLRPRMTASHYYPAGWPEVIKVGFMGAKYRTTDAGSVLQAPDDADGDKDSEALEEEDEDGNITLTLSGGQLTEPLVKSANLSPGDSVTKVPDNDPTFSLKVTRSSGMFSGSFTHTDDTTPEFKGMVYQKGGGAGGYGHFLTRQPKPIDYTGESGRVTILGTPEVP